MTAGRVAAIWRFPVKSMQGERLDAAEIGPGGLPGDRGWGVVAGDGKVLSAKREGRLLDARAWTTEEGVRVALPDGSEHAAGDPALDASLSDWLGRQVRLLPRDRAEAPAYDMDVDALDEDSPEWTVPVPPTSYADLAHVHLLTTASVATMAASQPESDWSIARFRPTVLVEVDDAGDGTFPDDAWVGTDLRVGTAVLDVFCPTPRCAMPGRAQAVNGLERDKRVLQALRDVHANNLGVYANVVETGAVRLGDAVG